jgi:sulfur-oxidizing protein SoxB
MTIRRRDFLTLAGAASLSGSLPRLARSADTAGVYDLERFGNARILHMTDVHAQLRPVFFREPSVNLGVGAMRGNPPHLVGKAFLDRFGIRPDSADAYAFTCVEFRRAAGRFSSAALRIENAGRPAARDVGTSRSLLLDGGDPGGERDSPTRCRAPTWSIPRTCWASRR